jgi:PAS domain S-box-containing protein
VTSASPSPLAGTLPPDHLNLLLDSTGEGIFGIDMDGRCTFVNQAAARTLGFSTDMVLGRNMHELIHHSHADGRHYPECDCPIFNAFRRGLPCRIDDEVIWRADGSSFPAEYSSHPIIENGLVRGAVVTFVDISERKRAEELLRRSHDEMEQRVAERTAQLRELANHLETMRETERKRIAREIHDELGSLLVALKMDLNWLERRVGDNALRESMVAKCQRMGGLVDTAVDAVGRIITDLRPSILDHQGLWAALEWQAQEFAHACADTTEVDFKMFVAADVPPPEGGLAIAVFRILQEVLSNVARHARAKKVSIRIDVDAPPLPVLYLQVRDDGVGTTPEALADPQAWGVMGLRERAAHFGGRVGIETAPGRGTTVRLMLPLSAGEGQT